MNSPAIFIAQYRSTNYSFPKLSVCTVFSTFIWATKTAPNHKILYLNCFWNSMFIIFNIFFKNSNFFKNENFVCKIDIFLLFFRDFHLLSSLFPHHHSLIIEDTVTNSLSFFLIHLLKQQLQTIALHLKLRYDQWYFKFSFYSLLAQCP